jgi:hypothetical protein
MKHGMTTRVGEDSESETAKLVTVLAMENVQISTLHAPGGEALVLGSGSAKI